MDLETLPRGYLFESKSKELKAYNNYRFNDEDIDFIINEKKRFSQKSDKVAEKKIELLKEREEAEQMGELERVKEIDLLIAELNEKQQETLMKRNGSFNLLAYVKILQIRISFHEDKVHYEQLKMDFNHFGYFYQYKK